MTVQCDTALVALERMQHSVNQPCAVRRTKQIGRLGFQTKIEWLA